MICTVLTCGYQFFRTAWCVIGPTTSKNKQSMLKYVLQTSMVPSIAYGNFWLIHTYIEIRNKLI